MLGKLRDKSQKRLFLPCDQSASLTGTVDHHYPWWEPNTDGHAVQMNRMSVVLGSLVPLMTLRECNLTDSLDAELEKRAEWSRRRRRRRAPAPLPNGIVGNETGDLESGRPSNPGWGEPLEATSHATISGESGVYAGGSAW